MQFLRVLMQSSVLRFSTFFLAAIILIPFDTPKTALAQRRPPVPPGAVTPLPGPDVSDYPDDDEVVSNFLGTDRDGTIMAVDTGGLPLQRLADFATQYGAKYLTISYTNGFISRDQRSDRWFSDFYIRCVLYFLKKARGWAYVLSNPDGPRGNEPQCTVWLRYQFPALKANTAVLGIMVVNIDNFQDRWVYWVRGDEDKPRRRPNAVDAVRDSAGNWLKAEAAVGTGAVLQVWHTLLNHLPSTGDDTKNRKDQPKGVETDVLPNSPTAELPDLPVGIDQNPIKVGVLNSNVGELSNAPIGIGQYPTDVAATDSALPDNGNFDLGGGSTPYATWGNSNSATSLKLVGRGRRIMQSRAVPDACSQYYIDRKSDPDNPSYNPSSNIMPGQVDFKLSASMSGPLYHWVDGDRASLTITQYERSPDSPGQPYNLDISIRDPNGNSLVAQPNVAAPPSQEIEIDSQGQLLLPLWVKVDEVKYNPISFRYGDPPYTGTDWNSDEFKDHKCITDPMGEWDASRKIMCLFKV